MARRKKVKKLNVFLGVIVIIVLVAIAIGIYTLVNNPNAITALWNKSNENDVNQTQTQNEVEEEPVPEDTVINIVGIGDALCHSQNFRDAYDSETGTYDFSPMFKNVTKYFDDATVAVGNLETTLAGADRGYSGYPTFNSPDELAYDLKEMGIDILTTANNHCLDKGYTGLERTLNVLDEYGIDHTGTSRSEEEQNTILMKDLNGIKTAFLCYTYGTNGIPIPSGREYSVNLIDKDFIKEQLDKAKEEGAELIVVSMHWGAEYRLKPTTEQEDLAEFLIKNGADVILGNHSHVPEPMEMKTVTLDDGTTREGFVIYSMGNFFSAQTDNYTRDTLILNVEVRKNGATGEITIDKATYTPVYVYDNGTSAKDRYELLDIEQIIKDYEAGSSEYSQSMYNLMKSELNKIVEIVGPEIDNTTSSSENNANDDNNTLEENNRTENIVDDTNSNENDEPEGELGKLNQGKIIEFAKKNYKKQETKNEIKELAFVENCQNMSETYYDKNRKIA